MATNDKPEAGRPTMPSGTSRNSWEYPGWPASGPGSGGVSAPPSERPSQTPRTTSVSPIAMPIEVQGPPPRRDLMPRILTLTGVVITVAVVGVYAARGPKPADWAGRTRVGADNMGQIVQRNAPAAQPAAAPPATFNLVAADLSMRVAEQRAANCARGLEPQQTNVRLTFGATGNVVYVLAVDRAFLGDKIANCIEDQFRSVKAPPFEGDNVTVTRRFSLP